MSVSAKDPVQVKRPGEFKRSFVPVDIDLGDWSQIEPLFDNLLARELDSPETHEAWLLDASELSACLGEEGSRRHIAMTCHTDDEELEQRYLQFVTEIAPKIKPKVFALGQKHLASPHRQALDRSRYLVYDRDVENDVALYREENIPLQVEEKKLENEHNKITGAHTVMFRGAERTMPQMARFLEETDRDTRRAAWMAMTERRLKDAEALSALYDKMIALRHQMALNAGFENYRDFQHQRLGRFDYTPADCEAYHAAVEETCVPAARQLAKERQELLQVQTRRPWDLAVDTLGREPLRPFETGDELVTGTRRVFQGVDPRLVGRFNVLVDNSLLDLESRPAKAPGGYQSTLDEVRLPFIFMNAAGTDNDVFTLLHEGGHAFHALATRQEPLHAYRDAPIEFCEVASMGMELMSLDSLGKFYTEDEANRSRRTHLERLFTLLPWIAQIDAFQHWIYTHPTHTREERAATWEALEERFGVDLDWSGFEDWRALSWQRQLHLYHVPFYYIEYGIAQLGALQLWCAHRQDPKAAVENYLAALTLGGSRPLPELFERAGLKFQFNAEVVKPLIDAVVDELKKLPA